MTAARIVALPLLAAALAAVVVDHARSVSAAPPAPPALAFSTDFAADPSDRRSIDLRRGVRDRDRRITALQGRAEGMDADMHGLWVENLKLRDELDAARERIAGLEREVKGLDAQIERERRHANPGRDMYR